MPSFYSSTLPSQMPLTPPDYYDSFSSSDRGVSQLPGLRLGGHNAQASTYENGRPEGRDFLPQYSQYTLAPPQRSAYAQDNARHAPISYPSSSQSSANPYGMASVPLLPPIRIPDRSLDDYQQQVRQKRAPTVTQPKEEKAMGGVAAHLDYEMEDMVDFVSQTAQGMYDIYASKICLADIDMTRSVVKSKASVHPEFRKYVSQVLSSTRLPSSTILLGLYYLAQRMTLLSANGTFNYGTGQVYRMLTIALLLGSKFLDDNTFQNRSWSEVSNIPVGEINTLEVEWLVAIDWNMHIDLKDPEGFQRWQRQWKASQASMRDQSLVKSLKQTHLTGDNVQRQRSVHQRLSPINRLMPLCTGASMDTAFKTRPNSQWTTPRYDPWQGTSARSEYSPPSAPETGPNTPEWYGTHSGFGFGQAPQQVYPAMKMPPPLQVLGSNAPQSGFPTPYGQHYPSYGHGKTCGCAYCMPYHDRYLMAGYGAQSVVG